MQQDKSLATTVATLDRPLTAAAVITLVLISITDVQAPAAWFDLVNLLLILTLTLLLFGLLSKNLRTLPYLLIPIFLLLRLAQLSPVASISQRLSLIVLTFAGIGLSLWFLRVLKTDPGKLCGSGFFFLPSVFSQTSWAVSVLVVC